MNEGGRRTRGRGAMVGGTTACCPGEWPPRGRFIFLRTVTVAFHTCLLHPAHGHPYNVCHCVCTRGDSNIMLAHAALSGRVR